MSNHKATHSTPIALTIAGSDSGGGAGIQADIKAISANGVYAASVITAVTAQNTCAVNAVHPIPLDVVAQQIDSVLTDLDVTAIKIGMLFSPELVETVANSLANFSGSVVLDPVMVAKSGDTLLEKSAIDALINILIPRVDLLTPNLPEAAVLLGRDDLTDQVIQVDALGQLGAKNILLKGGHGTGLTCTDTLRLENGKIIELTAPRIATTNTHGTGCTYSATISAFIAKGLSIQDSVHQAHGYLHQAIVKSDELTIGKGHGPVHHFHNVWTS